MLTLNLLSRRALRKLSNSLPLFLKATLNKSPLMIGQIGLQKLFVSFYVRSMSKHKRGFDLRHSFALRHVLTRPSIS